MKTVREWFELLEEPYRSNALKNMIFSDAIVDSMAQAISAGFVWAGTPEGNHYWAILHSVYLKFDQI